ncbi:MAG: hypothetical protein KKG59_01670 [Nanoarchaeota archaeon]|nr:hypothetical protein [Nanoarchaeota archaeon]
MFRKGQMSVEHLFVLMLAVMIIIPGTSLFYHFSKNSNHQVISTQITRIGNEIITNAEVLHFLGEGSRMRLTLNFPGTMTSFRIINDEISINYTSYLGHSEAVFFPDVPIEGYHGDVILKDLIMPEEYFHTGIVNLILRNEGAAVVIWEEGTETP